MINYKLFTVLAIILTFAISYDNAYADTDYGTVESSIKITGNSILTSDNTQTVAFEAGDRYGISVTNIDDFDGDGVPDIVIAMGGAHGYHISEGDTAMNILLMNSNGTVKDQRAITYDAIGLPDGCYDSVHFVKNEMGFGEKITWLGSITEGLDPMYTMLAGPPNTPLALNAISVVVSSPSSSRKIISSTMLLSVTSVWISASLR